MRGGVVALRRDAVDVTRLPRHRCAAIVQKRQDYVPKRCALRCERTVWGGQLRIAGRNLLREEWRLVGF